MNSKVSFPSWAAQPPANFRDHVHGTSVFLQVPQQDQVVCRFLAPMCIKCSPHGVLQRIPPLSQCFIINVRITCGAAVGTMASRPSDLSRERTQTPSAELRTRPNPMTWSSSFVDAVFWRVSRNSDTLPQNIMRIQSASSSPDNIRFPFCRIRGAVNLSASGRRKRPGMMDRMSPAAMLSSFQ